MQDALAALAGDLAQPLQFDEMLAAVTRRAAEALGCERASIRLFDSNRARLLAAARHGSPMHVGDDVEFRLGEGLIGWIAEHGKILRTDDAEHDERFAPRAGVRGPVGSFLGVPLLSRGECIGVLSVVHPDRSHFDASHESTLLLVAALCAPRIEIARLERLATIDPLTGALNRRGLDMHLASEPPATQTPLAALMVDIDFFKRVNDEHGHAVGDEVLRRVAAVLGSSLRIGDAVARWGGEEFLLLLAHVDEAAARSIAERARHAVESTPAVTSRGEIAVTVSIGLALRRPGESRQHVIDRADEALYDAKERGRNRVEVRRAPSA